jgi:5-formyltetrahydrofolate cyclo-ligase
MEEEKMTTVAEEKKRVRKLLKEIRNEMDAAYKEDASAKIAAECISSGEYKNADSIFIYLSMDGEPDTGEIVRQALAEGKKVYVPRCLGHGIMEAVRLHSADEVETVPPYGIKEPKKEIPATDPSEFDSENTVAFVPCVGAARDGRRLGHGAGYYDRFLEGRKMKRLMLAYGRLILEDIPCDRYDLKMDRVITE